MKIGFSLIASVFAAAVVLVMATLSGADASKAVLSGLDRPTGTLPAATTPTDRETHLSAGGVITIGVGAALSGANAPLGWQEVNSVQLAISQTNAAGGVYVGGVTYTLALVTADSGCDATQTITAANALLRAGAIAIVGHMCSVESMAAQPIYNAAGVAMVSPSSTNPQLTQ